MAPPKPKTKPKTKTTTPTLSALVRSALAMLDELDASRKALRFFAAGEAEDAHAEMQESEFDALLEAQDNAELLIQQYRPRLKKALSKAPKATSSEAAQIRFMAHYVGERALRYLAAFEAVHSEANPYKPPPPSRVAWPYTIGADMQNRRVKVGLWDGNAVAIDEVSGLVAIEPLRSQAHKLASRGRVVVTAGLLDGLDQLHVGDDELLELGDDDVIGSDYEVGAGKLRKKIKKGLKKAAKKVVKAAKKVAKSKLGKLIATTVSMVNPAAGMAMSALSKAGKLAKRAKKKKSGKAAATVQIADKTADGTMTAEESQAAAAAQGIPYSDVSSTAAAIQTYDSAHAGDPDAAYAVDEYQSFESADEVPIDASSEFAESPDDAYDDTPIAEEAEEFSEPADDSYEYEEIEE